MLENEIVSRIEKDILSLLKSDFLIKNISFLLSNDEINLAQDFANQVSIRRIRMNDHGRVHMRKVAFYAIQIASILHNKNILMNSEEEGWGDFDTSLFGIVYSALIHDIGMAVGRERHEFFSLSLCHDLIIKTLDHIYGENHSILKTGLRSLIIESVAGHMGNQKIYSTEAGILMVADGCDLEFGRAKPPAKYNYLPRVGDIHQFSAKTITKVEIIEGNEKPIVINIHMNESAGLFQVEEVLLYKINLSPVKEYIELNAIINEQLTRKYL